MSAADIIILIVSIVIVGLIITRIIVKRIKKDYCYDCSSKAGCSLKIEDLLKEMNDEVKL